MSPPFRLDGTYRRYGRVVIGGSPLRLFRLSPTGLRVIESIEAGESPDGGHATLTDRLIDAGVLHPVPTRSPFTNADVTIVVPAHGAVPSIHDGYGECSEVIVVDDASWPPLSVDAPWRVIRHSANRGPAAARNTGLAAVSTDLVAFVDTDVQLVDDWLDALLPHFADHSVALAAPRVASPSGIDTLARYENRHSPLDLGDEPARIAAGSRVSYVPAAALVMRVDALRAVGGFDETLRVGEDVDMVWRLVAAGYRCRYEPASTVHHRPRSSLHGWMRQRVAYGRSAAALDRRHRGKAAPLRTSGWTAAVWALVAARRPLAAGAAAVGTIVALRRKLVDLPVSEAVRLAGLGHLYAGRQIAITTVRSWWPLTLAVALCVRRSRVMLLGAGTMPVLLDWCRQRGPLDPWRYVALRLADDVAYGTGVWLGCFEQRSVGALLPQLTNWPGRTAD